MLVNVKIMFSSVHKPRTHLNSMKHCKAQCKTIQALTLSQTTNFTTFQTTIFKFDENGGKSSKRVENTVGKGEIARNEQFLLFPQCFQNTYTAVT